MEGIPHHCAPTTTTIWICPHDFEMPERHEGLRTPLSPTTTATNHTARLFWHATTYPPPPHSERYSPSGQNNLDTLTDNCKWAIPVVSAQVMHIHMLSAKTNGSAGGVESQDIRDSSGGGEV